VHYISHKKTQQIFLAQCVRRLASIIGLEQELVFHIDQLQGQENTILQEPLPREVAATPSDVAGDRQVDQVLDCTEQFLKESKWLREIAALKISRETSTGRINPLRQTKKSISKDQRITKSIATDKQTDYSKTEGIDNSEISRRKAARECLRCTWPFDRTGNQLVKDCIRRIKLDKGTAISPKDKIYQEFIEPSEGGNPADSSDSEDNTD